MHVTCALRAISALRSSEPPQFITPVRHREILKMRHYTRKIISYVNVTVIWQEHYRTVPICHAVSQESKNLGAPVRSRTPSATRPLLMHRAAPKGSATLIYSSDPVLTVTISDVGQYPGSPSSSVYMSKLTPNFARKTRPTVPGFPSTRSIPGTWKTALTISRTHWNGRGWFSNAQLTESSNHTSSAAAVPRHL